MAYISTRGHGAPVDLQDLLVRGTAEDGGLYVPEDWPTLSSSALSALARKSYSEIASGLLELFGGENWKTGGFSEGIRQSLDNFAVPEGPPLVKLDEKLWALELFHGPTFAFKDYALVPHTHPHPSVNFPHDRPPRTAGQGVTTETTSPNPVCNPIPYRLLWV